MLPALYSIALLGVKAQELWRVVLQIKAACKRGDATEMAEQLLQLFDISSKDKELE